MPNWLDSDINLQGVAVEYSRRKHGTWAIRDRKILRCQGCMFFELGNAMVTITATAYSRLSRKLKHQPEGTAVRITVQDGHVQFRPDTEQKGDLVFAHGGQSVLLVGAETASRIANRTLGVVKTSQGERLRFIRPV